MLFIMNMLVRKEFYQPFANYVVLQNYVVLKWRSLTNLLEEHSSASSFSCWRKSLSDAEGNDLSTISFYNCWFLECFSSLCVVEKGEDYVRRNWCVKKLYLKQAQSFIFEKFLVCRFPLVVYYHSYQTGKSIRELH